MYSARMTHLRDDWIVLRAGESRTDIQYVMAIDLSLSDVPPEYEWDEGQGSPIEGVHHPHHPGQVCESFGVIKLTQIA